MSKISELETTQLRQLYYLLSIDVVQTLRSNRTTSTINAEELTTKVCLNAKSLFGITLEEEEIYLQFIAPLVKYLDFNSHDIGSTTAGEYGLSKYHFEFTSALSLFINARTKQ